MFLCEQELWRKDHIRNIGTRRHVKKGTDKLDASGKYPLTMDNVSLNLVGMWMVGELELFVKTFRSELRITEMHVKVVISEYISWACSLCELMYQPEGTNSETICATFGNMRAAWLQKPDFETIKKLSWALSCLGEH